MRVRNALALIVGLAAMACGGAPPVPQVADWNAEAGETAHLVVMNLDGDGRRVLTSGPGRRYGPRWSPDGQWLLYTAEGDDGQYDIRALRLDDGHDLAVRASPDDEREADWMRQP